MFNMFKIDDKTFVDILSLDLTVTETYVIQSS